MQVRMIGGPHAGEIRNLPFVAARGAISNGLAKELGAEPELEPATLSTTLAEIVAHREDERPQFKRRGKRR